PDLQEPMRLIAFAAAALLTLPIPTHATDSDVPLQEIEALVKRHAELDLFSGTVIVADQGKAVYSAAYGDADKDRRIPNRIDTNFNIGSIGKTFTGVAIMQLVEGGKLKLDDTLDTF